MLAGILPPDANVILNTALVFVLVALSYLIIILDKELDTNAAYTGLLVSFLELISTDNVHSVTEEASVATIDFDNVYPTS